MEVLRHQTEFERRLHLAYPSPPQTSDLLPGDRFNSKLGLFLAAPPSPPQVMSSRVSLPSIADILNPANEDDHPPARPRRPESKTVESFTTTHMQSYPTPQPHSSTYRFPPTPPPGPESIPEREKQPLPVLQPNHTSRMSPPLALNRKSRSRHGYGSVSEITPQMNASPGNLRSPEMRTPHSHAAAGYSLHPYRRSPDFRYGRRSQSPQNNARVSPPRDTRVPLTLPNGSLSPGTSVRDIHQPERRTEVKAKRRISAKHEPLATMLASASPPYSVMPISRSMSTDVSAHASHPTMHQPHSYSVHSSPPHRRTSNQLSPPHSESYLQQSQQVHSQLQASPRLAHTSQPLAQILSAHATTQGDRYNCATCGKCFSRPSSLRIHSHSHTGEKPFRCSREGCGKAFSVRSNMKRHERGCHAPVATSRTGYCGPLGGPPGPPGPPTAPGTVMLHPTKPEHLGLGVTGVTGLPGLHGLANAIAPNHRELAPALD